MPVKKEADKEDKKEDKEIVKATEEKPEDKDEVKKAESKEDDDKLKKEEDDEEGSDDEDDEETKKKKKKKAVKSEGGKTPEADTAAANTAGNTVSPNAGVPSATQDVFVPSSSIDGKNTQETPMGKSASIDLMKSPLYKGVMAQIDAMNDAFSKRLDAFEKSQTDRANNIVKALAEANKAAEKFYSGSFYKAVGENVAPEGLQQLPIKKAIEEGKVRFSRN